MKNCGGTVTPSGWQWFSNAVPWKINRPVAMDRRVSSEISELEMTNR